MCLLSAQLEFCLFSQSLPFVNGLLSEQSLDTVASWNDPFLEINQVNNIRALQPVNQTKGLHVSLLLGHNFLLQSILHLSYPLCGSPLQARTDSAGFTPQHESVMGETRDPEQEQSPRGTPLPPTSSLDCLKKLMHLTSVEDLKPSLSSCWKFIQPELTSPRYL